LARIRPDFIVPNANLKLDGIPPIPVALVAKTALYTEFRPRALASWHPLKRELIVATRATNTAQLFSSSRRSRSSCSSPTTPSRFVTECGGRRSPMCSSSRGTWAAMSSGRSIASTRIEGAGAG
jgi:hypothetical protein